MLSRPPVAARFRPRVESLEERDVPATFVVNSTADSGMGSLRDAITSANSTAGADQIVFAIGTGPQTITLTAALPTITETVQILGNTQPGFTDPSNINPDDFFNTPFPPITIDGTGTTGADGLVFSGAASSGSQVLYTQVLNFDGNGIAFDNSANGLLSYFVSSGNGGHGVLISGAGATGNRLQNGFIGVDKTGNVAVPNGGDGVLITNTASGNVVGGGNFFQARNIISGNLGNGVHITGGAFGNLEQGNVIGLNTGNDLDLGNGLDGVLVDTTGADNIIGGPIGLGGIHSGNGRHGVSVVGQSPGTIVFNAFAGVSAFSNLIFPNDVDGIHIEASGPGIIVTTNIASGNGRYGLYIGGNANGVIVNTLLAGVGFPGLDGLPNGVAGVIVTDNATNTQIGTITTPPAIAIRFPTVANAPASQLRSIFAGNAGPGVIVEGNATNTTILNSNFGSGSGETPFPNAGPGVLIRGNATGTVVGSTQADGRVLVKGNLGDGIRVETANPVTIVRPQIFDNLGASIAFAAGTQTQPSPVLASVAPTAAGALAAGSVTGTPNATLTLEFFASADAGEAQTFLTSVSVTTDPTGLARFSVPLTLPAGLRFVTATATSAAGATSALSDAKAVAPAPVIVTGPGAGGGPVVNVFAAQGGTLTRNILAYEPAFRGEVRLASADVTGDGVADFVIGAGPGGGPRIRAFDGVTGLPVAGTLGSFFAYESTYTGGVFVAAGDVNGDGFADIVVGTDAGGGPAVKVFSGRDGTQLASYFAYEPTFLGGVRVAVGDVNGDGVADVITTPGVGGGPRVKAVSGTDFTTILADFFAFDPTYTGGLFVSAGDVNGFGIASIIAGVGTGGSDVRWFAADGTEEGRVTAFPGFTGGVTVAAADANGDGLQDIVVGAGPGGGPSVAVFDSTNSDPLEAFFAYEDTFTGGVFVGGA